MKRPIKRGNKYYWQAVNGHSSCGIMSENAGGNYEGSERLSAVFTRLPFNIKHCKLILNIIKKKIKH